MTFVDSYADHLLYLVSAAMIFLPLEHILPRVKREKFVREGLRLDLLYMLLGALMIMLLSGLYITLVVGLFANIIPERAQEFVRSLPLWASVILLIVAADFYYYWAHRLFHTFPILWKFHSIHHSIKHLDWIAAHRTHPIDTAITNSGAIILAILFDFGAAALLIFSAQFSWHSLLKHSNIKISWGLLRWLYLTPTFHHWHHANVVEAYDKNFAGQLPIWDLLFGTAIMEEKAGPLRYGVDDPVPTAFLASLVYPFMLSRPEKIVDAGNLEGSVEQPAQD